MTLAPKEVAELTKRGFHARPEGAETPNHQEVALLIDGENVSSHSATEILACAQSSGEVTVRRLYGNFAACKRQGRGFRFIPPFDIGGEVKFPV